MIREREDEKMNWVDDLIKALEASVGKILAITVNGQTIQAMVKQDTVDFFKNNKTTLSKMGKQTFADFMGLIQQGKKDEAFNLMLKSMSADDILVQMNMTKEELKAWNDTREKFWSALEKFALQTLAPQLLKILVAMLIA